MKKAFNALLHHNGSRSEMYSLRLSSSLRAVLRALWFVDRGDSLHGRFSSATFRAKWFFCASRFATVYRYYIFPDTQGCKEVSLSYHEIDQTWTGDTTFSKGTGTTTVTFGTLGNAASKACFNTKNTDGEDISFYFVGTTMVVENGLCQ